MQIGEAKQHLIQTWGSLGTCWGVNRTMAQVHALLMLSEYPLSAEDVMEQLQISRGNANMNLRALIDWGLARRECRVGERKEFFVGEKDMWRVAIQIIQERQKREIAPALKILEEVKQIDPSADPQETAAFIASVDKLSQVLTQANEFVNTIVRAEKNWMSANLLRLFVGQMLDSTPKEEHSP
jgi:DNA-binding transcriptional regulator GbsR (MarR family)